MKLYNCTIIRKGHSLPRVSNPPNQGTESQIDETHAEKGAKNGAVEEDMEVDDEEFHSAMETFHTSTPRKANDPGPSSAVHQPQPSCLDVSGLAEVLDEINKHHSKKEMTHYNTIS